MNCFKAIVCLATFGASAFAVDGVVLINQATVLAAGGFPYTINQPGSYRLAGNLQATNTSAITILAPNVSLDLNGFSVSCTQCSGVAGIQSAFALTTISNGTVYGFGGSSGNPYGIYIAAGDAKIDRVSIFGSGTGLYSNGDVTVTTSSFINNSVWGIYCAGTLIASHVKVAGNPFGGIKMAAGTVTASSIASNGTQSSSGTRSGITALSGSIIGNMFADNGGFQLYTINGPVVYGQNSFVGTASPASSAGSSLGTNVCQATFSSLC